MYCIIMSSTVYYTVVITFLQRHEKTLWQYIQTFDAWLFPLHKMQLNTHQNLMILRLYHNKHYFPSVGHRNIERLTVLWYCWDKRKIHQLYPDYQIYTVQDSTVCLGLDWFKTYHNKQYFDISDYHNTCETTVISVECTFCCLRVRKKTR